MRNKRVKIEAFLKFAEAELDEFRVSGKFTNLSQACEKTWVAFTLLLELNSGKEIKGALQVRKVSKDLNLLSLYLQARTLHIFHYEGSIALSFNDVVGEVQETISQIRGLM